VRVTELRDEIAEAVRHFWRIRDKQGESQGGVEGDKDRGSRAKVTGGAHIDGFVELIARKLREVGCADEHLIRKQRTELPGFFRPTKEWDLLVIIDGHLVASIEFKSQVGSFGNNYNNRTEEAIGNATDLWTAYREGAFNPSVRPWLGYFMLLEDARGSTRAVGVSEPHFKVFEEFRGASYAKRYELLLTKLVRERLYDAACFIMSDREHGPSGAYREPSPELAFAPFLATLIGKVQGFMKMRAELPSPPDRAKSGIVPGAWTDTPER
jgi:hypothetical protein